MLNDQQRTFRMSSMSKYFSKVLIKGKVRKWGILPLSIK